MLQKRQFNRTILSLAFLAMTSIYASATPKSADYHHDEAKNANGPNRCQTDMDCDGLRTCSAYGWCQGTSRPVGAPTTQPAPQAVTQPTPAPAPTQPAPQATPTPPSPQAAPTAMSLDKKCGDEKFKAIQECGKEMESLSCIKALKADEEKCKKGEAYDFASWKSQVTEASKLAKKCADEKHKAIDECNKTMQIVSCIKALKADEEKCNKGEAYDFGSWKTQK